MRMKNRNLIFAMAVVFTLTVLSCDDIFLEDIADSEITLFAPRDSMITSQTSQLLAWHELKGATGYQLLIVTPDLLAPDALLMDTTITTKSFSYEFSPGKYQWCVKGVNGGYETDYSCRTIEIVN
jgi:hypothetical protein